MERLDLMLEPLRAFLVQIGRFLPQLALALAIIVIGWLMAKTLSVAVRKGLRAINFHVLTERAGMDSLLQQSGTKADATALICEIIYWTAILVACILALGSLGLDQVTNLLGRILLFGPNLILAVVIFALGFYFSKFVKMTVVLQCEKAKISDATHIGELARYAVMAFVVLVVLDQLDIGAIVRHSFLIVLAGVVLALALAFGYAGRDWAASLLQQWWPHQKNIGDPDREQRARIQSK